MTAVHAAQTRAGQTHAPQARVRHGVVRRKCACGGGAGPTGECDACRVKREASLRRMPLDGAEGGAPHDAPPIVYEVLNSGGRPLDAGTREFFGARLGHDFSRVRLHTGPRAAQSAALLHADAYTVGHDIVFSAGRYAPGTSDGTRLLAHELAHVYQQRATPGRTSQPLRIGGLRDAAEQEAQAAADLALHGLPAPAATVAPRRVLRRQGAGGTGAAPVGALTVNIGSSGLNLAHVPPCGSQLIRFTAGPRGAAPIAWSLAPGSAAVATGTALAPSADTLTAELALGPGQKGGTLEIKAGNSQGDQTIEYPLASHPTGITSTSVIGDPVNTTLYGGVFDHEFTSNDGQASSLDQVAVGEKFPSVPAPGAASHTLSTPFGSFTLTTGTLPDTPSAAAGNWFLTNTGELGGTHDTVGIQKSMIDIGRHLASDSNPHPANPLPAGFTIDQQFFWWCPHAPGGHRWTQAAATTHTRRLRLDSSGTDAEFVAIVNGQENAIAYEGTTGVTNARADPATVAPSPAAGPANTVQIAADAFPSSRPLHFSIQGNARGCTINHTTGELTIGHMTGTVKVRVANANGGPNWDEVDVTIAVPAAPTPPPPPAAPPGSPSP